MITAFLSQKGGVCKSTLARALACEAVKAGLKVKLGDLDTQQKTSVGWGLRRAAAGILPAISIEAFDTAASALKVAPAYDLLIIDGPARTSEATKEIAREANLVVQPTGPAEDDLQPALKEFHALVEAGIPKNRLVFALTRVGTAAEEADARHYLTKYDYVVLDGVLMERPAYRKAQNKGRSITETSYRHINREADALMQALIDRTNDHG